MILALCLGLSCYSVELNSIEPPGPTIGVQIVFGKKKLDCLKFGICYIQITFDIDELFGSSLAAAENGVGYGYATKNETDRLNVRLIKTYMTAETLSEHFVDGNFRVDEDYKLPEDIALKLGLKPGYAIRTGVYKYTENSKEIILTL